MRWTGRARETPIRRRGTWNGVSRAALVGLCGLRLVPGPGLCRAPWVWQCRGCRIPLRAAADRAAEADVEKPPRLPRHRSNAEVNSIIERAEEVLEDIAKGVLDPALRPLGSRGVLHTIGKTVGLEDRVFANSYVNLDAAEVVGFDYDYTLVSYKPALLHLLYDRARATLVNQISYPVELLEELQGYDPNFAIRGLAVDMENAWICKLTYRYRVATAFFGRERVPTKAVQEAYRSAKGFGVLPPDSRRARLRPLNDIFSLVEACLLADVVQWFKDRGIPFQPCSVVKDVLEAVGRAHTSGEMHRAVVEDLDRFIEPDAKMHLRKLLSELTGAGKKLMLVSNSPFWYVNAGMSYVAGDDWRGFFNVVVVSAGKPAFYTQARPFREVSARTGRVKFKPIHSLDPGEVYCAGSIEELMRLTNWTYCPNGGSFDGSKIIYFGDSLFADLVDARRLYGWTTGAIIQEVRSEMHTQSTGQWRRAQHTMQVLMHCAQLCQEQMSPALVPGGPTGGQQPHTQEDRDLLDALESLMTECQQRQDASMNANFGSIFRTSVVDGVRSTSSFFALCLQRHVDIYTSCLANLRLYSTDHRFYPSEVRVGIPHELLHTTDSVIQLLCGTSSDDAA